MTASALAVWRARTVVVSVLNCVEVGDGRIDASGARLSREPEMDQRKQCTSDEAKTRGRSAG